MAFVTKEIRNHIAYITLDRPKVNALTQQCYEELGAAFNGVYDELDEVRVVIFTAAGKHFIAGNDLNEFESQTLAEMNEYGTHFAKCLTHIYNCPVPVIGAINGTASGAGFCIAAVCDVLVAAEEARFGLPEIRFGMLGGLAFTPWMVPRKLGRYMSVTGNLVPARRLEEYGSVYKVVPKENLMAEAEAVAADILLAPPRALRLWKRANQAIDRLDLTNIEHITDTFIYDMRDDADVEEAGRAFFEKRKPVYTGR